MHRAYAWFHNYYWVACPKCGRNFGGHEKPGGVIYDYYDNYHPDNGAPRTGRMTCFRCVGQWEVKDGEMYPIWGRVFTGRDEVRRSHNHA